HGVHTSYGLTWQWTIASATATPTQPIVLTPEITITAEITTTPTITTTPGFTVTPVITSTPTITDTPKPPAPVSPSPSPSATPTPTMTPTATPTPTRQSQYLFSKAEVADCQPNNQGSRFSGYVKLAGQPVAGYRVVFSYEPDGNWATQPAITSANPLGYY